MIDHDRLFKQLLSAHIWEFIDLFLPAVAGYLDKASLQLLDKELFSANPSSPRLEADLVFKGKFKGQESFFLILLENQATAPPQMPRRTLFYFFGLTEKYNLPVYPVVIYSHQCPQANSNEFRVAFPDFEVLIFRFRQIILPRLSWKDYLAHPNPVASALMSLMGVKAEDRVRVKVECFRMLANLRLDQKKKRFLSGFIDTYLRMTAAEVLKFTKEVVKLDKLERGKIMEMTTSWKEEGRQEGRQEGMKKGIQIGRQEGQLKLLERLLKRRYGALPKPIKTKLQDLTSSQLEKLADNLSDFKSLEDVETWLFQNG